MSGTNNAIRDAITTIAQQKNVGENIIFFCEVIEVNQTEQYIKCEVVKGNKGTFKVTIGDDCAIYPDVNSQVIVLKNIIDNSYTLLKTEEISNIAINVSDTIILNGGANGGLVNVDELTTKINTLTTEINNLKTIFNTWVVNVPPGSELSPGVIALYASTRTWVTLMNPLVSSDYEDTNILH